MFCDQCEQTYHGTTCTGTIGVCGKNEDVESLQKILLYGLKGMAAYKYHARRLGKVDPECDAFEEKALFATVTNVNFDPSHLLELVLECGMKNFRVMELLNDGHVENFGKPTPAEVFEGTKPAPGILVTGHDMQDLMRLLTQLEGSDVKVYTHGEMLPAHMYPKLKNHPNLAGHWGGPWQKQLREFEDFGGAILATTNCVIPPKGREYESRFFTTSVVGLPGVARIQKDDFTPLIHAAKQVGPLPERSMGKRMVGFHWTVLADLAPQIVQAVQQGEIKRFFVIGGCDGYEPGRSYFSQLAQALPKEAVILTLGCGKYRIHDHDYGSVAGFPRLLDMGQCNDAYGAIKIALALAEAFKCTVNDLPLSIVLSWFEQKAVAVLLTLLALGVHNIKIGPTLPAFVTPNIMKTLQKTYNLQPIGQDPIVDMQQMMKG